MRPVYNNSATIILLISLLTILLVANTNVRAQLLKDTFDDANWKSRWEIHDDGNEGAPSQWSIGPAGGIPDGAFGTPTNILRGGGPSKKDEQAGCYALTLKAGSEKWTDYRVSADMYHMDNDYAGLFVRYVDELNYFRVWSKQEEALAGNSTSYGMEKVVKGEWKIFFGVGNGPAGDGIDGPAVPKDIPNIKQREWFNMTVEVVQDTVTMYLNKKKVDSIKDSDLAPGGPLSKGKIALYNSTNPMAYDNVEVGSLAVFPTGKLSIAWGSLKAEYER